MRAISKQLYLDLSKHCLTVEISQIDEAYKEAIKNQRKEIK